MTDDNNRKEAEDRRKSVLGELAFSSTKLSDLSRAAGFGLAGLIYVFATSSSQFAQHVLREYWTCVLILSIAGAVIIALDYFQYIFAYLDNLVAVRRANDIHRPLYGRSVFYILSGLMFLIKQGVTIAGVIGFAVLFIRVFLAGPLAVRIQP
jgi:hypothetical protein